MTVSSETSKVSYTGNGSLAEFSTSFLFDANDEVVVTLVVDATGAETEWTEGTEYTLTGAGSGIAGTVTVDTSPTDYTPAVGETLVVQLKPDFLQGTALPRGGTVSPKGVLEPMHDQRVRQLLRLKDGIDRSLQAPLSESSIGNLPTATTRASKLFSFDGSGDPTVVAAADLDLATVTPFMLTLLDDEDQTEALATLGVDGSIADNSITLAKLDHGTSGDILYYAGSGAPTRLAKGTDAQVLTLASGLPSWAAPAASTTPTAAVLDFLLATPPSGWLNLNGQTIGSATSGATYANADAEDLFLALWDSLADAQSPILLSGGGASSRGGDAGSVGWAANKRLTLPDSTGRASYGLEASATRLTANDIDGATLGDTGGVEQVTLTTGELPNTGLSYTAPSGSVEVDVSASKNTFVVQSTTGSATGAMGSGGAHNNLGPGIVMLRCIKL